MGIALARPAFRWRQSHWLLGVVGWFALNALIGVLVPGVLGAVPDGYTDWNNLAQLQAADPYATAAFRWTPLAGWLWTGVQPLGYGLFAALHFAALFLLPVKVAILVVLSFPFWADTLNGNVITFIAVAGFLALAGNRAAAVVFVVLAVLMPRPLVLPLLGVLVWRDRSLAWVLAGTAVAVLVTAVGSGQLVPFLERVAVTGSQELPSPWNLAPSHWIGYAWLVVGVPLAAALVWMGWPGAAGVALSPYVFGYYFMMLLPDAARRRGRERGT